MPPAYRDNIHHFFLPLAKSIDQLANSKPTTFYVGVNGCQGSGKSTLSDFLAEYFISEAGKSAVVMSLDDFYFDSNTRLQLANDIHPLLKVRGVPGTHNTGQLKKVLQTVAQNCESIIPRFNKATDNPFPQELWHKTTGPVDIVIMEGWCWGVTAQDETVLPSPVNALEAEQDPDVIWRRHVNDILRDEYQPLYDMMDYWVMLKAPSFKQVFNWRCEQEHKLAAKSGEIANTKVMSDEQIWDFIQYYQRLTEHALNTLPTRCHTLFELGQDRSINKTP